VYYALVNFKPHSPTLGRSHTPGGDLTLTFVPTPGAVDIEAAFFPIFMAKAWNHSSLLLFEVATAQYLTKMCCQIPYKVAGWLF